jgi:succinate-acetate transporter protein
MSYAAIFIPGSGILAAYGNNTQELSNAVGLYLIVWFMFTMMLMYVYGALSFSVVFLVIVVVLSLTYTELLSNQPVCNTQKPRFLTPPHRTRNSVHSFSCS